MTPTNPTTSPMDDLAGELGMPIARYFFEIGYAASYADAYMARGQEPPFELTDQIIDRAWQIAPECNDDPEEFDAYLAAEASLRAALRSPIAPSREEEVERFRMALKDARSNLHELVKLTFEMSDETANKWPPVMQIDQVLSAALNDPPTSYNPPVEGSTGVEVGELVKRLRNAADYADGCDPGTVAHIEKGTLRRVADILAQPNEPPETAWLIEWSQKGSWDARWWCGSATWNPTTDKAIRFARKVDAERVICDALRTPGAWSPSVSEVVATEHMWMKP